MYNDVIDLKAFYSSNLGQLARRLITKKISWEVVNVLIYNKMLANEILITDYNIYAENVWRRISVLPKDLEKRDTFGHPDKLYNINFVDSNDYFIKRNF